MIEEVRNYGNEEGETLRNLTSGESVIINHVVMEPGQSFPAHITEHDVHIIIIKGSLLLALGGQEPHSYREGQMVSFPRGVVSALSNHDGGRTELFVVKSIKK